MKKKYNHSMKRSYIYRGVCLLLALLLLGGCALQRQGDPTTEPPTATDGTEAVTTAPPFTELPTETVTAAPTTAPPATEPTTAEPTTPEPTTAEVPTEPPTEPTTAAPAVPQSKDEIIAFFAKAVNDVRSGAAGYTKKEFDTLGDTNVTGNAGVDNMIRGIISANLTSESQAKPQDLEKGSAAAMEGVPGWTLTDNGKVASAALTPADGDYSVTVVMEDEDSPRRGQSHLAAVGTVLFMDDVEEEMKKISVIKSYEDMHIRYSHFTITATLTPEGRIKALTYHTDITVELGKVEVPVMTLRDVRFSLESTATYIDFKY